LLRQKLIFFVEACPFENKEATMSLLHSFYCWGAVGTILLSTIFFAMFGMNCWNWLAICLMVCSGASELAMAQWASAYAEAALGLSKAIGDLAGPCMFAVTMGISRVFFSKYGDKVDLTKFMMGSGILCVICYLLASSSANPLVGLIGCILCGFSVGIMWPGTISISSKRFPAGGTVMFALLAMAGDLGGSIGPGIIGRVTQNAGNNIRAGMGVGLVFPAILLIVLFILSREKGKQNNIG